MARCVAIFGIARPRIGLCGVNPHAGEDGEIGREEIEIINPAAVKLRAQSISQTLAPATRSSTKRARAGSMRSSQCITIRAHPREDTGHVGQV